jgi:hypothetical protein
MNAISADTTPQEIMMRASHSLAIRSAIAPGIRKRNSRRIVPAPAQTRARRIQILVHRQRGVADVDAIDVGDDRDHEERENDIDIRFCLVPASTAVRPSACR